MYDVRESGVLKTVESWCVFVPLNDNKGNPFSTTKIEEIIQELLSQYPGFSVTNSVGYWKNDARVYQDANYQIVIDVVPDTDDSSSTFFANLKNELQQSLDQEKIYITKQTAKQELLTFDEFFDEVGIEPQTSDVRQEAAQLVKRLTTNFSFVLQRLGYETTALIRNVEKNIITWERKLCGIRLKTELNVSLPDGVKIIAADQVTELGDALASDEDFALIGGYEFQSFILDKHRPVNLVKVGEEFLSESAKPYRSQYGELLSTKRFIEEFSMTIFTNWVILRDEGFLPSEIKINVGQDGSMQWTTATDRPKLVLRSPAIIDEPKVQKEIIRCLGEFLSAHEDSALDELAILQAKAKNNYILKRAIVRHIVRTS